MAIQSASSFEAATDLLTMMIARVTTRDPDIDAGAFHRARTDVLADPVGKDNAPMCVRTCRSPDEVWSYIKSQREPLDTYESRRIFLRQQFEPLLSALESFDVSPIDDLVSAEADGLAASSILATWQKAVARCESDPEGAITAARALVESTCKTILDDLGEPYGEGDDLPKLYRCVAKALKVAPEDRTEEQIKRILGGCMSAVEGLGSLRNRSGDAHGRGRISYKLGARHAFLAVNLAGTVTVFLAQTFEARGS
ncbi:MAG TPA: abortive infection family protein [Solirubrobacterales bacterium]|nr:abortive infection family protein [Solirubrobacterales bacterium]